MQLKTKNLSFNILFIITIATLMYACYSTDPNSYEPREEFPLKVTGQGSNERTWIGADGRTYVLTFSKPVYVPTSNDK